MSEASTVMFFVWQIFSLAQMQLRTMAEDDYDQFYKVAFLGGFRGGYDGFYGGSTKKTEMVHVCYICVFCGCCPRMLCAK